MTLQKILSGLLVSLALYGMAEAKPSATDHVKDLGLLAAQIRELAYRPVASQEVTQAECAAYVKNLVEKELREKPRPAARQEAFLRHVGLLTGPRSVKEIYIDLLTDQVRGLYDPKKKRFLVMHGPSNNMMERGLGLLLKTIGVNMEDIYTVHEMGHAVQDQHFNLDKISHAVANDFDRELAAQALIEGDATVVMFQFTFAKMAREDREMQVRAVCQYDMGEDGNFLMSSGALGRTPRFFKEALTFPYMGGSAFVNALRDRGGWKAVNGAFKKLPESTEQIFHPEKYGRDHPLRLKLERLPLDASWKSLGQDTAGEFSIRVLAKSNGFDPNKISGWGGDRYEVFKSGSGTTALWDTQWDDEKQATYFKRIAVHALTARHGKATWKSISSSEGMWTWTQNGLYSQCQSRGKRVRIIFDSPTAGNLLLLGVVSAGDVAEVKS